MISIKARKMSERKKSAKNIAFEKERCQYKKINIAKVVQLGEKMMTFVFGFSLFKTFG